MPSPFYPRPEPREHGVNWRMVLAVAVLAALAVLVVWLGGRPVLI